MEKNRTDIDMMEILINSIHGNFDLGNFKKNLHYELLMCHSSSPRMFDQQKYEEKKKGTRDYLVVNQRLH